MLVLIKEIRKDVEGQQRKTQHILALLEKEEPAADIEHIKNCELFYLLISNYSVQRKAPLSDKYLINKLNFCPVTAKDNCGDAEDHHNHFYEFKTSFTNKGNKLNLRQIRLWQKVDNYYCFFINEEQFEKSLIFTLTKEQMKDEVQLFGSATHGAAAANKNNECIEYSFTIDVYNDKNINTKRWKEKYLNTSLMRGLFNVS